MLRRLRPSSSPRTRRPARLVAALAVGLAASGGTLVLTPAAVTAPAAAASAAPVAAAAPAVDPEGWVWPPKSPDGLVDTRGAMFQTWHKCAAYQVPPGVSHVDIHANGGFGRPGAARGGHGGGEGGRPARVHVRSDVEAGQFLYIVKTSGGNGDIQWMTSEADRLKSYGRGGDGIGITTYVGPDCALDDHRGVLAFAGGGGGGGDGAANGPGGTGGNADQPGNDGSGDGSQRAGKGGRPGTATAPGAGGAGGSVWNFMCFCTTHGRAGSPGVKLAADNDIWGMPISGGEGGWGVASLAPMAASAGGGGGGGLYGGGGGGASHGIVDSVNGGGLQAGTGSGGGGGGGSFPAGAATPLEEGSDVVADTHLQAIFDSRTTLTSSQSPVQPGRPVTLTATVETVNPFGSGLVAAGDLVTFRDLGAVNEPGESGDLLGSAPLVIGPDGSATASLTVPGLSAGTHHIRGSYTGKLSDGVIYDVWRSSGLMEQVVVAPQTVTFTSTPGARAAYGPSYTPTATSTSQLPVSITVDPSSAGVCFIDPAQAPTVSFRAAGSCVLNADQAGSEAFLAATRVKQTITVAPGSPPKQQVITFTSTPPTKPAQGDVYEVSAVGGASGNPVTFTVGGGFGSCFLLAPNRVRVDAGGPCRITASQAGGNGYLSATAEQSFFIGAFSQSIWWRTDAPASASIGDVYALQLSVSSRRLATVNAGPDSACTVVRTPPTPAGNEITYATVTAVRTGTCVIEAQETTDDVYHTPSPLIRQSYRIGQAQTVSFAGAAPREAFVGQTTTPVVVSTTRTGGAPVVVGSSTPTVCSVSGGVATHLAPGTCTLTADQAGTSVYAPAPRATQSFTVHSLVQTVAFGAAPEAGLVDQTYTPVLTGGGSVQPVTLRSRTTNTCTVAGRVVTFTGAGVCTLEADQAGDATHLAASPVQQEILVLGLPQTVVATSQPPTGAVVGDTYTPTAAAAGQPVQTDVLTPELCSATDGVVTFTAAGSCVVALVQPGTSRYAAAAVTQTVPVGPGAQVLSFASAAPEDAMVDGTYTPELAPGGSTAPVVLDSTTPLVCTVAGGEVLFVGRGECEITADQDGDNNYLAAPTVSQVVAVAGLPQVVVPTNQPPRGAVVGDSYAPAPSGGDSGEPVVVGVSTPDVCAADDGVVSFTGAGSCVVTLSQAGTSRYAPRTVRLTIEVDKGWQTLSFASAAPVDAVVDGTYTPEVTGGRSSAPVVLGSTTPQVCTAADGVVTFVGRGSCEITADREGDDDYVAADTVAQTVAVAGLPQVIALTTQAPTGAVVGDTYQPVATGGGSESPVLVEATTPQTCAIQDGVVSFTAAGSCDLRFSQAGSSRFEPAEAVTRSIEVGRAPQSPAFVSDAPTDAVVDGTYLPVVTPGASSAPVVLGSATPQVCTVADGVVSFVGRGSCEITADQDGDADHLAAATVTQTVAVAGLPQVIVPTTEGPEDAVVGDTYEPAATGGDSGSPVEVEVTTPQTCAIEDGVVTFTRAQPCDVRFTQAGSSRHAPATAVTQSIAVAKAPQTVAFASVAPTGAVVGDTYAPELTGGPSSAPVVLGTDTPLVCTVDEGVATFVAAGDCVLTATQDGDADHEAATEARQSVAVAPVVEPVVCRAVVAISGAPRVVEGDSGTRAMDFPVSVTGAEGCGELTVTLTTPTGTARAGTDYVRPASTLRLAAGATSGRVRVSVRGDVDDEANETVRIRLGAVRGDGAPSLGNASATGTIVDDDVAEPLAACRPGGRVPRGYTLVRGTSGADHLVGTAKRELFRGGAGNDRIVGGAGDDILCGNAGRDVLLGGAGNDKLSGGPGVDRLVGGPGRNVLLP